MIDVSMMTMNWAAAISPSAHQRRDVDRGTAVVVLMTIHPLLYP
jgi:hypothetical protein